jgi:hypothetical protein
MELNWVLLMVQHWVLPMGRRIQKELPWLQLGFVLFQQ